MSRILLVEDNPDLRLVVKHVLIGEGYEVDAAENVGQGRALLDNQLYDLLLTDGKLPDGNGVELANAATDNGIPALVMTGYAFILRVMAPDLSRYRVLLKPLRPAEIVDAVAGALAEPSKC